MEIPEQPEIACAQDTGYPNGEPTYPHCPICGAECSTVYTDYFENVVGCNECIGTADAWGVDDCFPEGE